MKTRAGARRSAPRTSAAIASSSSRTITVRVTAPPSAVTVRHNRLELESSTSPSRTSLPADTISAVGVDGPIAAGVIGVPWRRALR